MVSLISETECYALDCLMAVLAICKGPSALSRGMEDIVSSTPSAQVLEVVD